MLDLLIANAKIVDGSGAASRIGDVGIRGGRIVLDPRGPARRTIDAGGKVLAPGFIDIHTHYDAQLGWDPYATPSLHYGTTTIFAGNCGFALAPLRPETAGYLMRMMSVVEGMPLIALETALDWDWTGYGEWLARFEGKIGINAGFLAGHSAIRLAVMGPDATSKQATPEQIAAMTALLEDCLGEGAFGFSTSLSSNHLDADGNPVPSRRAGEDELLALASAVRKYPGTNLEMATAGAVKGFAADEVALMARLSGAAQRPINWNTLHVRSDDPDFIWRQLAADEVAAREGGRIVALCLPRVPDIRVTLASGMPLNALPGWGQVFALPIPARMQALADPATRDEMRKVEQIREQINQRQTTYFEQYRVLEGYSPETKVLEGRTLADIAAERGTTAFDALLDIALADELRTAFALPQLDSSDACWDQRLATWNDGRTVLGGSDAGAHLDLQCGAAYTADVFANAVRARNLLSVEEAVRLLTDAPARLYGLKQRGRIEDGWHADLVIFDPDTIAAGPESEIHDLPGGASRVYGEPAGIEHVIVNGVEVIANGRLTGAKPGAVLRAGRDSERTSTVEGPEARRVLAAE